eukprot:Nk52_evm16s578 gene=Nk52_evmTU16s578
MSMSRLKQQEIQECLSQEVVDLDSLSDICYQGIPDDVSLRADCWKYLLRYTCVEKSKREKQLKSNRDLYRQLKQEFLVDPRGAGCEHGVQAGAGEGAGGLDHPLSDASDSIWNNYHRNVDLWKGIEKDIRRTFPSISFFHNCFSKFIKASSGRPRSDTYLFENCNSTGQNVDSTSTSNDTNGDSSSGRSYLTVLQDCPSYSYVLGRILFVYCKLNPGIGYVQGFSLLLAPIFYTLHNFSSKGLVHGDGGSGGDLTIGHNDGLGQLDKETDEDREADTFFCFTFLMTKMQECFIDSLDRGAHGGGIQSRLRHIDLVLKQKDRPLYVYLVTEMNITSDKYAFRWLSLLFAQDFHLPDVIRLWDSLLSEKVGGNRVGNLNQSRSGDTGETEEFSYYFAVYIGVAMLILERKNILNASFEDIMAILQDYPVTDINLIIRTADSLRG